MNDFDIANVRWWNLWKCNQACEQVVAGCKTIEDRSRALINFSYEPAIGKALAEAENTLNDALFAVKQYRLDYEKLTSPHLQAAE